MTRLIRLGVFFAVFALAAVTTSAQRPSMNTQSCFAGCAGGVPSMFKVTVTQVEIYNGTSWTTLFTGTAQLDMMTAAGATFPGISAVYLPRGTYSQLRVTFGNSFVTKGSLGLGGTTYYTTAATLLSDSASVASSVVGDYASATIRNPTWGNLGDAVVQTMNIGPLTVSSGTAYTPTLTFDLSSALTLFSNSPSGYYFALGTVTITLV